MTIPVNPDRRRRTPIHPGEILRDEFLKPLGLSANKLAQELGVTAPRVNDLVLERRGITADMAYRLARYLRTTPELWMNLQLNYELDLAAKGPQAKARRKIRPRPMQDAA
jgi:antitoxin HigA-1